MGMKSLMCEILVDKQKELIKSFESQLKAKNEIIIKEIKRANEMFKLSYNRKLQIKEQQAEINKLREVIKKQDEFIEHMWINHPIVRGHVALLNKVHNARKALNGESGKK